MLPFRIPISPGKKISKITIYIILLENKQKSIGIGLQHLTRYETKSHTFHNALCFSSQSYLHKGLPKPIISQEKNSLGVFYQLTMQSEAHYEMIHGNGGLNEF